MDCFQLNTIKFSKIIQLFSGVSKRLKIFRRRSEGAAEGGYGGNSAAPERWSPAACSVRSRSQQKSFLFLLEEKIGRAQIKKCKENCFAGWRALASGGGANQLPFRSKKVRAKCKISPPMICTPKSGHGDSRFLLLLLKLRRMVYLKKIVEVLVEKVLTNKLILNKADVRSSESRPIE